MCASIEFLLKKHSLTEEDVNKVEELFQKVNFDYRLFYYEKMLKDNEQREKEYEEWKQDNPEKAIEFERMKKEIEEKFKDVDVDIEFEVEEVETEYTEEEKNTLVILTQTHNKRCLCSFDDKELLLSLFNELLDIFDEVHYDSAADSYGSFSFSWTGEKVYSLSKDKETIPWEPEMGYGPIIQVIK